MSSPLLPSRKGVRHTVAGSKVEFINTDFRDMNEGTRTEQGSQLLNGAIINALWCFAEAGLVRMSWYVTAIRVVHWILSAGNSIGWNSIYFVQGVNEIEKNIRYFY